MVKHWKSLAAPHVKIWVQCFGFFLIISYPYLDRKTLIRYLCFMLQCWQQLWPDTFCFQTDCLKFSTCTMSVIESYYETPSVPIESRQNVKLLLQLEFIVVLFANSHKMWVNGICQFKKCLLLVSCALSCNFSKWFLPEHHIGKQASAL